MFRMAIHKTISTMNSLDATGSALRMRNAPDNVTECVQSPVTSVSRYTRSHTRRQHGGGGEQRFAPPASATGAFAVAEAAKTGETGETGDVRAAGGSSRPRPRPSAAVQPPEPPVGPSLSMEPSAPGPLPLHAAEAAESHRKIGSLLAAARFLDLVDVCCAAEPLPDPGLAVAGST
jgi:hypothetical protein